MIVTASGWIFIVISILSFFQLRRAAPAAEQVVAFAGILLYIAVGVGLLLRRNWARWLALGISLLSWTVGTLFSLYVIAKIFGLRSHASLGRFLLAIVLVTAILGALIWLFYRLFEYLTSEDGRFEFDTPDEETHAVAKSTAFQVAWFAGAVIILYVGMGRRANPDYLEVLEELSRSEAGRAPRETRSNSQPQFEAGQSPEDLAEAARLERAERTRQLIEESERRMSERRDASQSQANAFRESSRPQADTETQKPTGILKCRDASGSISFTQNYCPAGTTLVETPRPD